MQDSGPTTTATSQSDGRMKVASGCPHGKKNGKCLKCVISKSKKDGRGGPGFPSNAGYGAPKGGTISMKAPPSGGKSRSFKIKGMKSLSSSIKSLNKNKFGKALKSAKTKSLKSLIKKGRRTM